MTDNKEGHARLPEQDFEDWMCRKTVQELTSGLHHNQSAQSFIRPAEHANGVQEMGAGVTYRSQGYTAGRVCGGAYCWDSAQQSSTSLTVSPITVDFA